LVRFVKLELNAKAVVVLGNISQGLCMWKNHDILEYTWSGIVHYFYLW